MHSLHGGGGPCPGGPPPGGGGPPIPGGPIPGGGPPGPRIQGGIPPASTNQSAKQPPPITHSISHGVHSIRHLSTQSAIASAPHAPILTHALDRSRLAIFKRLIGRFTQSPGHLHLAAAGLVPEAHDSSKAASASGLPADLEGPLQQPQAFRVSDTSVFDDTPTLTATLHQLRAVVSNPTKSACDTLAPLTNPHTVARHRFAGDKAHPFREEEGSRRPAPGLASTAAADPVCREM